MSVITPTPLPTYPRARLAVPQDMQSHGIAPNVYSFNGLMQAFVVEGNWVAALDVSTASDWEIAAATEAISVDLEPRPVDLMLVGGGERVDLFCRSSALVTMGSMIQVLTPKTICLLGKYMFVFVPPDQCELIHCSAQFPGKLSGTVGAAHTIRRFPTRHASTEGEPLSAGR